MRDSPIAHHNGAHAFKPSHIHMTEWLNFEA